MKIAALLLIAATVFPATSTMAAEKKVPVPEIIVNDGIAFSWKEDKDAPVVAYDVVSAWKDRQPLVADCAKYSTTLKGAKWCFENAANMTAFTKKTDKDSNNSFIPFVGGRCALGTSWGRISAEGDPRTARIIQGDLGPILVLQSAQKWWPMFEKHMFSRLETAQMRFDFAKRVHDIVPNDAEK